MTIANSVRQSPIIRGICSGIYHASLFTAASIEKVATTVFFGYVGVEAGKMMGVNMEDKIQLLVGGEPVLHREQEKTHIVGMGALALALTAHWISLQLQQSRISSSKTKNI